MCLQSHPEYPHLGWTAHNIKQVAKVAIFLQMGNIKLQKLEGHKDLEVFKRKSCCLSCEAAA